MAILVNPPPPCLLFEDEHLLVVNKPAGMNTHVPGPFAGEGIYEWLRHREPRWAGLAIIHRLDKETSGVLVLAKTSAACRSLTAQFTQRLVRKKYLLLTDRSIGREQFTVVSTLVRSGGIYVSRPDHAGGVRAETRFTKLPLASHAGLLSPVLLQVVQGLSAAKNIGPEWASNRGKTVPQILLAEPLTGRTHQIRVQAAEQRFPILGDAHYGGSPASRLCLHAVELTLAHPASGQEMTFTAPVDFAADPRLALRQALVGERETGAWRLIHGAADGRPGWYVDVLGGFLLSQSNHPLAAQEMALLQQWLEAVPPVQAEAKGVYHKILIRQVRQTRPSAASPQHVLGIEAPERFVIVENGVRYELSFAEGYSVGLFLDQRDNRRRFLTNHVAADFPLFPGGAAGREVLNTFAYTCGFSVCAALAGARTTSLDLSKKYLEWGRRNFRLNGLDPAAHDFIFGEAFEWLRWLAKKGRQFDAIVLDPPTFSQSKTGGVFRVQQDYGPLAAAALPLLKSGGVLLASANVAALPSEQFLKTLEQAVRQARRRLVQQHYVPQPPDFPICRDEPAYLKTCWLRIA